MRAGWTRQLRDLLWCGDPKGQLIAEAIVVEAEDTKDLQSDWQGADSLTGLATIARGGIQLEGTESFAFDYSVTPDADVTALGPAAEVAAVRIEWRGQYSNEVTITAVTVRVDPRVDNGLPKEVAKWVGCLFRVETVIPDPTGEAGGIETHLTPIGARVEVAETGEAIHDVTFTLVHDGRGAVIGDPPKLGKAGDTNTNTNPEAGDLGDYGSDDDGNIPRSFPVTVFMLFAYTADGTPATNCSWRAKAGAGPSITTADYVATHTVFASADPSGRTGSSTGGNAGSWWNLTGAQSSFPYIKVASYAYSTATATYTSNKVNLGTAPSADVAVIARAEEPGDSSAVFYISDDNGANWYECSDGDFVATNNTESGHDLTAVSRQQTYSVRVVLTPTTSALQTPVARQLGVQELGSVDLAGAAVVEGCSWKVDPVTLKGEIGQPTIRILKTGERDYKDYFSHLFSHYHIGEIQIRLWVGHPDLERRYWLHLDTFDVEDTAPGDSQGTAVCLSVLGRLRTVGMIPRFDSGTGERTAVAYAGETIGDVYDDLTDSQIALPARLVGPGIPSTVTDTISKTIRESDAKNELDAVAYLAGYAPISSQGRVKAVQMMDEAGAERPPLVVLNQRVAFTREEVRPIYLGPGFTNRIDEFFVKTNWNDDTQEWDGVEARGTWVAGLDEKLRSRGVESRSELDEETAKWIDSYDLGAKVALRVVQHFACGMMLWEIESTYPHPYLEPGDVVVVQTDQFVARNPSDDSEIRGVIAAKGTVTEVNDAMGRKFVVWIKNFSDIVVTNEDVTRVGFGRPKIVHARVYFTATGLPVLQAQASPGLSIRAVADPSNFQSAGTILLASAHATDANGWVEITLGTTQYQIDDDVYVSALAYETAAGSGSAQTTPTTIREVRQRTENSVQITDQRLTPGAKVPEGETDPKGGWYLDILLQLGKKVDSLRVLAGWIAKLTPEPPPYPPPVAKVADYVLDTTLGETSMEHRLLGIYEASLIGVATVDAATDFFTDAAHGLVDDDWVYLTVNGINPFPGGVFEEGVYQVAVFSSSTFKVVQADATIVDITSDGTVTWTQYAPVFLRSEAEYDDSDVRVEVRAFDADGADSGSGNEGEGDVKLSDDPGDTGSGHRMLDDDDNPIVGGSIQTTRAFTVGRTTSGPPFVGLYSDPDVFAGTLAALTDDTPYLQAAQDRAAALVAGGLGGGIIQLNRKTYIATNIECDSHVTFQGQGWGTCVKQKAGATGHMFTLRDVDVEHVTLRDFVIDGNKANVSSSNKGIYFDNGGGSPPTSGDAVHRIINILVLDTDGDGIHIDSDCREFVLENCHVQRADGYGYNLETTDSVLIACTSGSSGIDGFNCAAPNTRYFGCKAFGSGRLTAASDGFRVTQSRQYLIGCEAQDNGRHGFHFDTVTDCSCIGFSADSNGVSTTGYGIRLAACTHGTFIGNAYNRSGSSPQAYAIDFGSGTSTNNHIHVIARNNASGTTTGTVGSNCHIIINGAQVAPVPSGTYTPSLTGVTNVGASTAFVCQWSRSGDVVTVSGKVDVDPTGAGAVELGISLPVASNFTANQQCSGAGSTPGVASEPVAILADTTNDRASMQWVAVNTANQPRHFSFTYLVL